MWNAVHKAMCRESRLDYYNCCFRSVRRKPSNLDLQKTIVCNCYCHSMKNARLLCNRSCESNVIQEGVYWTNLMFSCTTLYELDEVVDCFFILTNCMMTYDLVKEKYEKLQNWSQQHFETSHRTSDRCERAEEGDYIFTNKRKTCSKKQNHHYMFPMHLVWTIFCNPAFTAIMWLRMNQLQTPITISNFAIRLWLW